MFKLDSEKAEEPEIKLPTSTGSEKQQDNSRKTSTSASLTMLKPLTGRFFKRWDYETTLPASWDTCTHVKKHPLELDMEQWTVSKLGKKYVKDVHRHPAYLTYMQSSSHEMLCWRKHKLESKLQGEISIISDIHMTSPLGQKAKRN